MVRLRTLGRLALDQDEPAEGSSLDLQPKRLALLVYLAVAHSSGTCSRDTLVALFWPNLDDAHARNALRQGLHALRQSVGAAAIRSTRDGRVGVDPTTVECDVVAFGATLQDDPAAALSMYVGPFLDGVHVSDAPEFERWTERERRRLELEAVEAAWRLAEDAVMKGNHGASRRWAERAVELAPYDELGLRRYLEILDEQADPAAAVHVFETFRRRLDEDLGLDPSPETAALVERIRTRKGAKEGAASSDSVVSAVVARPGGRGIRSPRPAPIVVDASGAPRRPTFRAVVPKAGWGPRRALAVGSLLLLGGIAAVARSVEFPGSSHRTIPVAVLPFRSLGADSSQAYLADALRLEIVDQLSRVSSLRVVGPVSMGRHHAESETLKLIGQDLDVDRVVEGEVEIAGDRLRVFVHLLNPESGRQIWGAHFDGTLDDVFAVQTEIAERIAAAVGVTSTRSEGGVIRPPPTQDASAYRLYLQGLDYERRPALRHEDGVAAQQLLERALALDSLFGPAHAALSMVDWREYDLGYDRTPERLALAQREAEAARRLAPDLPETHLAIGLTEHVSRDDFRGALEEFRIAARSAPNHADTWTWIGAVDRSLGAWNSAFAAFERARSLDPSNATLLFAMGNTHHYLHQYREAIDCYRQALALAPDMTQARLSMAWSYALWQGQVDTLKAVLASISRDADPGAGGSSLFGQRITVLMWEGRADSVVALLRSRREDAGVDPRSDAITIAQAETLLGDTAAARVAYRQAEAFVDSLLTTNPESERLHATLGIVLGALGRRSEALREADFISRTDTYRKDRYHDGWLMQDRAQILVQAGIDDAALAEIEKALSHPSGLTVYELRHSAVYAPIRGDPRFQALLRKYAATERGS